MMRVLGRLVCLVSVGLLGCSGMNVAQQQSQEPQQQTQAQTTVGVMPAPKDARTRAKVHTELGSLYFQDGKLIIALEELTLAAAIDPDYAPAFSTRGLILYHVKEFDSAEKDFRRALTLDPRNSDINNNFGWFLCHTGRAGEAIAYFEQALGNSLYQTPELAYMNAGECLVQLGQLDRAEDYLRRALRLSPENPQALFHLATVFYKRGNYDAARKQLLAAARYSSPGPQLLWLSLRVERRLGNKADEESLAAQLRRRFPDSSEYQAYLKGDFE